VKYNYIQSIERTQYELI